MLVLNLKRGESVFIGDPTSDDCIVIVPTSIGSSVVRIGISADLSHRITRTHAHKDIPTDELSEVARKHMKTTGERW
jgi:sRNA-binding carbon storage regulator CsrA